ncbi:hypothetical protein BC831DRAFT_440589, partial [Entophlyctis helioformis]
VAMLPLVGEPLPIVPSVVVDGPAMELAGDRQIEGYVDWITACLREMDQIELIGVDPALTIIVSITLVLRERSIAFDQGIETTTYAARDGSPVSGLRVVLVRDQSTQQQQQQQQDASSPVAVVYRPSVGIW